MPSIQAAFLSKYLKAADLNGKPALVRMASVSFDEIGDEQKPILHFTGNTKPLVLNRTNANSIADLYGDDYEEWSGKHIEIYPTKTDFQGRRVDAIRVREPRQEQQDRIAPNARARSAEHRHPEDDAPGMRAFAPLDDEIPFAPQVL